jgi:hypothetical protein
MSAPPPLTRPKAKSIAGVNTTVIPPPRRVPPPPTADGSATHTGAPAIPAAATRAISPPSSFAVVRTVSPPSGTLAAKAPTSRPQVPTTRRALVDGGSAQQDDSLGAWAPPTQRNPPPVSLVVSPAEILLPRSASTDFASTATPQDGALHAGDTTTRIAGTAMPLPSITMAGSPGGEVMWPEDSVSDEDFDMPVALREASLRAMPVEPQPAAIPHRGVVATSQDDTRPFNAPTMNDGSASLMIVDDDDDDVNFSAPAPPPPLPQTPTPPALPVATSALTPSNAPRTPTQHSSGTDRGPPVAETPQALRELLRSSPMETQAPAKDSQGNHASPPSQSKPEMDFTVEPFEYWYQQEEKKRDEDRVKTQGRRTTTSIDETIKRLSKPKAALREDQSKVQPHALVEPLEGAVLPPASAPLAAVGWNAPSSDRPNETHYYATVRVLDATHHLALPRKATCGVIAEALSLQNIGVLATKRGAFLNWSDGISEGRSPGMAGLSMLHVVSFVELDEETAREQLYGDYMSSVAHFLAFSEWVLRCSNRISRHIFFDATDDFEDACTV